MDEKKRQRVEHILILAKKSIRLKNSMLPSWEEFIL